MKMIYSLFEMETRSNYFIELLIWWPFLKGEWDLFPDSAIYIQGVSFATWEEQSYSATSSVGRREKTAAINL